MLLRTRRSPLSSPDPDGSRIDRPRGMKEMVTALLARLPGGDVRVLRVVAGPAGWMLKRPRLGLAVRGIRFFAVLRPMYQLKTLHRPQWLFDPRVSIPHRPITFTAPAAPSEAELELCERIMAAFALTRAERQDLSPLWESLGGRWHAELVSALTSGDRNLVATQLRWMHRRPFVTGVGHRPDTPAAAANWSVMTYDGLVSLAEAVGAIRVENPEQGVPGRAFAEGIDGLPGRIEDRLGVSLDFPQVGAPYGTLIGGRLITLHTGRLLQAAVSLHEAARRHLPDRTAGVAVLEIGAGFGGVAMWYLRLLGDRPGSFTIVDLPVQNAFQAYFLGMTYGPEAICLHGEDQPNPRLRVVGPAWLASDRAAADVVFNQDSMPEMTETAVREYLEWMQQRFDGIFVSCNQEVGDDPGRLVQHVVSEIAVDYDRFERLSRQLSWTRRGYVDEVYRVSGAV
jgi:hypothetical protein